MGKQHLDKHGQPIIVSDLAIRREEEGSGFGGGGSKAVQADWLCLLVQNETGYLNLLPLFSPSHLHHKVCTLAALPMAVL